MTGGGSVESSAKKATRIGRCRPVCLLLLGLNLFYAKRGGFKNNDLVKNPRICQDGLWKRFYNDIDLAFYRSIKNIIVNNNEEEG